MPNKFITVLKTNENKARTKTLVITGITVGLIAAGIYVTKKTAAVPIVLEVVEVVAETATDIASE